ncbi:Dual specificity protein phosphatase 9 [Boothiomyces macroporosus]|uniref:protein-tyrosine-phosphatase n=1 Tax=Boothiomyces macroporosus TaxID=261099 RepID=A0AAD5UMB5_9FUNG|nr:Dual specificity protein phosphatase 9 [Boothiomyces macroporosus]
MIDQPKVLSGITHAATIPEAKMASISNLKKDGSRSSLDELRKSPSKESLALNLKSASNDKSATPELQSSPNILKNNSGKSIAEFIRCGQIKPFTAQHLELHMKYINDKNMVNLAQAPEAWGNHPLSILIIDMRSPDDFKKSHLKGSINPNFPMLVTKRFKKRMYSNFNLSNFLAPNSECLSTFERWKQMDNGKKCIMVCNTEMEDNYDDDTWTLLGCLANGLSNDICQGASPLVTYLYGGMQAVYNLPSANSLLHGTDLHDSEFNMKIQNSPVGFSELNPPNSPPIPSISKLGLSGRGTKALSIDLSAKKDIGPSKTVTRKPTLNLIIGGAPEKEPLKAATETIAETPVTSPNDNAAPPQPFSRVNKNIMVGSDLLPLAPDGPQQLTSLGVTHILNMAAEIPISKVVKESGKFGLKWIPVLDNTEVDMDEALQQAIDFISDAVSGNPNAIVFVHCKAGRSRSVSAVIGYLVAKENYTLKTAYDLMRKVRKGVSPNLGFMAALLKVEKEAHGQNSKVTELYS